MSGLLVLAILSGVATAFVLGIWGFTGLRSASQLAASLRGFSDDAPSEDPSVVSFFVEPGATTTTIAQNLERAGLVRSAVAFRVQAEMTGASGRLSEGRYELRRNMTVSEILAVLVSGRPRSGRFTTIPEGWRAEEIASYLEANGLVGAEAFLEAVAGRGDAQTLPLPAGAQSFEGYLFPETYDFGREPTAASVLRTLVAQFERRVSVAVQGMGERRGLSLHELVTVASIIEREAVQPDERSVISAVFHNRLARGMPLQSDPTTQYALVPFGTIVPAGAFWKTHLTRQDLETPSPYNTYHAAGLPPGPIANPGLASILAAADPADVPWLYFVARSDGSHLFARSLDEHLANVARVRREDAVRTP